jgi:hypothetical protein
VNIKRHGREVNLTGKHAGNDRNLNHFVREDARTRRREEKKNNENNERPASGRMEDQGTAG